MDRKAGKCLKLLTNNECHTENGNPQFSLDLTHRIVEGKMGQPIFCKRHILTAYSGRLLSVCAVPLLMNHIESSFNQAFSLCIDSCSVSFFISSKAQEEGAQLCNISCIAMT